MSSLPDPTRGGRCTACDAPLAHDQRYCIACGERRGPLPTRVAIALDDLAGSGRIPAIRTHHPPSHIEAETHRTRLDDLLPHARAAAVSIMLMLGVGCVIGAGTSAAGVTSLAHTVVLAFSPATTPTATAVASTPSTGRGNNAAGHTSGAGGGATDTGGGGGGSSNAGGGESGTSGGSGGGSGSGGGGTTTTTTTTTANASDLPPIGHVWEIVLSGQGYDQSFGDTSADPYLARTLAKQGELVSGYDAVATSPLANEIALISGQGPTPETIANCPDYADIAPGTTGKMQQVLGSGCLYPSSTQTLGLQLQVAGLKWRAYIQGIGDPGQRRPIQTTSTTSTTSTTTTTTTAPVITTATDTATTPDAVTGARFAARAATSSDTSSTTTTSTSTSGSTTTVASTATAAGCPHPAEGAADDDTAVGADDGYVTWKNPWVYFHSVIDATTCAHEDVGLSRLAKDLEHESTTPAFSYIAPDPCDDGSDTPCRAGAKAGLARADAFLRSVVPEIERSPAYKDNGLILVTFDEGPQSGPDWSTASCCGQPTFPNLKGTTAATTTTTSTTGTAVPTTTDPTAPATPTTTDPTTTDATDSSTTGTTGTTGTTTTTTDCAATTTTTGTTTATPTTSTTGTTTTCAPTTVGDPPGGGQVGLLLLSPYVKPGTFDTLDTYNHFSLLKSVEKLFGLSPLGYAAGAQVPSFNPAMFLAEKRS